jgi:hypothetical protein
MAGWNAVDMVLFNCCASIIMEPFKPTYLIFILLCFCSCNNANKNEKADNEAAPNIPKAIGELASTSDSSINAYDSLINLRIDTTTLAGKREYITNRFYIENDLVSPDYDTLIDVTYDGNKDYIIGYYGRQGTGIKNRVKVYFFNTQCNCYILNEQLSDLPNPTFYIRDKKITGFYIGNGGGGGGRLEWLDNRWTTTKEFEVDNDGDTTKWKLSYPLKKKTEIKVRPYQMIPPKDILETDIKM